MFNSGGSGGYTHTDQYNRKHDRADALAQNTVATGAQVRDTAQENKGLNQDLIKAQTHYYNNNQKNQNSGNSGAGGNPSDPNTNVQGIQSGSTGIPGALGNINPLGVSQGNSLALGNSSNPGMFDSFKSSTFDTKL